MSLKSRFIFLIASGVMYCMFWYSKDWIHFSAASLLWLVVFVEIVQVKPKYDEWERENL